MVDTRDESVGDGRGRPEHDDGQDRRLGQTEHHDGEGKPGDRRHALQPGDDRPDGAAQQLALGHRHADRRTHDGRQKEPERRDPDVADMFMIDHIEEHFFEHGHEISEFDHKEPVIREQLPHVPGHGLDVVDMGKHVVRADGIRFAILRQDLTHGFFPEVTVERGDTALIRIGREIPGRFHPDPQHSLLVVTRNKQAVITADIDRKRSLFFEPRPHVPGILREMLAEGFCRGTHIKVIVEHEVRRHGVRQLDKMALPAFDNSERTAEFGFCGIFFPRQVIRERLKAEVQESLAERGIAITACFPSVWVVFHKFLTLSTYAVENRFQGADGGKIPDIFPCRMMMCRRWHTASVIPRPPSAGFAWWMKR